jgi:hypothetical protein
VPPLGTRLGAALLLTCAVSGCTDDGDPGPAATSDPTPGAATTAATRAPDPLRFSSSGTGGVLSCFPRGSRDIIYFDRLRVDRSVTLTGVTGGGDATRITGTWLAATPRDSTPMSGTLDLDAGGVGLADVEAWADRTRLAGAALEPGRRYMFFIRTTLRTGRPPARRRSTTGAAPAPAAAERCWGTMCP